MVVLEAPLSSVTANGYEVISNCLTQRLYCGELPVPEHNKDRDAQPTTSKDANVSEQKLIEEKTGKIIFYLHFFVKCIIYVGYQTVLLLVSICVCDPHLKKNKNFR